MNLLEFPLDAVAVNYLSFGFLTLVHQLWTGVAVITAAVSFWKIRASGSFVACPEAPFSVPGRSSGIESVAEHVTPPSDSDEVVDEQRKPEPTKTAPMKFSVSGSDFIDDSATKGKWTLYYYEEDTATETMLTDEGMEEQVKEEDGDNFGFMYGCESPAWWESWERMLKLKTGDSGWHRFLDLTVVNGNVVRLWDCCRTDSFIGDSPRTVVW